MGGSVNAAAANFTKGLSRLGMRDGVHVNAIHPGQTATERTERLIEQRAAAAGKTVEEAEKLIREAIELHLTGLREGGLPIPQPSSQVEYIEVAA